MTTQEATDLLTGGTNQFLQNIEVIDIVLLVCIGLLHTDSLYYNLHLSVHLIKNQERLITYKCYLRL